MSREASNELESSGLIRYDPDEETWQPWDGMTFPKSGQQEKVGLIADNDLPKTVHVLNSRKGTKVYLIGTNHVSKESCEDVAIVIEGVQPDIVMLELCKERTKILQNDDETTLESLNLSFGKRMKIIWQLGVMEGGLRLMMSMYSFLAREYGIATGGEMRRAVVEAQKVPGCVVLLGDRPASITRKRCLQRLSICEKLIIGLLSIKLVMCMDNILSTLKKKTSKTEFLEKIEKSKESKILEMTEKSKEIDPEKREAGIDTLKRVILSERDIYLTHSLQVAADAIPQGGLLEGLSPPVVVAVVGMAHLAGIVSNWGKVTEEDIKEILKID